MKCLILNGSPKLNGNTNLLINQFVTNYAGETQIINAFPLQGGQGISSCRDCGGCRKVKGCVIKDDFQALLKDDYDTLLLASPIYMSNLPGPMINVVNRFNYQWNNKMAFGIPSLLKLKKAKLILLGGGSCCKPLMGESNEDLAIRQSRYIFKKLNAQLSEEDVILALNTDQQKVEEDEILLAKVKSMAENC